MPLIDPARSALLVIDVQARLMPAIDQAAIRIGNTARLIKAAQMLGLPRHVTEQNPARLGATIPELEIAPGEALPKMTFDSLRDPAIATRLGGDVALVVCGCEAHVCVLQTVLALRAAGRTVHVVADATGSRTEANRTAGLDRMRAHGADIVTTEMVLFEWLGSAANPAFKALMPLIK
ncbi:isochorismatase family protein [Seohaeicola saemankumensis]|uniref:Isochorismatase family protein n=1 Tax=Seohaeicola saemankumensis TaxID=481181 RepID=A0ABW3T7S4_9RHOB